MEKKLDKLGEGDEQVRLLRTVDGVGPRLAEAVVCSLDDPQRFKSGDAVSYAGSVPRLIESGTMSRVGRITRRGPSLLRGMLIEVAWVVWRKNAWAKAFVARVSRGMRSRKKIAIVALARRLLVKLWAMLRTNTPWREFGPRRRRRRRRERPSQPSGRPNERGPDRSGGSRESQA